MRPIIESQQISFTYQGAEAPSLRAVDLTAEQGHCVVLCGMSGSGKTTFSRLLNGLCPMFFSGSLEGACRFESLTAGEAPVEAYVPLVGSVFQNPKTQYFSTDTTAELAFPCENAGLPPEEIKARIREKSEAFEIEALLGRSIFHLSGGEKQQIAFAGATMLGPKLLVLDEPTSNLDAGAIERLRGMALRMKEQGVTLVIAEHRLAWLKGLADRYVLFEDGRVSKVWDAEAFDLLAPEFLNEQGLRSNDLAGYKARALAKEKAPCPAAAPLLEIKDLKIGYSKKKPLSPPDLALYAGEITGLMGLNGTGKTTLAKALCGLLKPFSGQILLKGKKASCRALTAGAYMVMQDVNYQLFSDSVKEEVLLGASRPELCDEVLESLGLQAFSERHPMSLSGGQKQRVAIASAILSGKDLIVLDEPTSGLDFRHMRQVGLWLEQLKAMGKAVLVITHDEELAALCCDRVIRLKGEKDGI